MFDSLKQELSRRALLHKAGYGFMGLSVAGAVGQIIKPIRTLAQAGPAPSNEPSLPTVPQATATPIPNAFKFSGLTQFWN